MFGKGLAAFAVAASLAERFAVLTASAVQVRRPINQAGVGSADPYREYLTPFVEAYYR